MKNIPKLIVGLCLNVFRFVLKINSPLEKMNDFFFFLLREPICSTFFNYTLKMLGCFNPILGKIWTNPAIGLHGWVCPYFTQNWVKINLVSRYAFCVIGY